MDKQDYRPQFQVGQEVHVDRGFRAERIATIIGRKVTRTDRRCNTFYQLSDGTDAWEATLEPTSCRVLPAEVATRYFGPDNHRLPRIYSLDCSYTLPGAMLLRYRNNHSPKVGAQVAISAPIGADGLVEAVGPFTWTVCRERGESGQWHTVKGTSENLGGCIVAVDNALCSIAAS